MKAGWYGFLGLVGGPPLALLALLSTKSDWLDESLYRNLLRFVVLPGIITIVPVGVMLAFDRNARALKAGMFVTSALIADVVAGSFLLTKWKVGF